MEISCSKSWELGKNADCISPAHLTFSWDDYHASGLKSNTLIWLVGIVWTLRDDTERERGGCCLFLPF